MKKNMTLLLSFTFVAVLACGGSEEPMQVDSTAGQVTVTEEQVTVTEEEVGVADERTGDPAAVTGVLWEWVSTTTPLEQTDVDDPTRYTIRFQPDGRLEAQFDCNRGGGEYTLEEGKVTFSPMISTRMACPEGSLDSLFMKDVGRATSFFVESDELFLEMPADSGTLRFRKAAATE